MVDFLLEVKMCIIMPIMVIAPSVWPVSIDSHVMSHFTKSEIKKKSTIFLSHKFFTWYLQSNWLHPNKFSSQRAVFFLNVRNLHSCDQLIIPTQFIMFIRAEGYSKIPDKLLHLLAIHQHQHQHNRSRWTFFMYVTKLRNF